MKTKQDVETYLKSLDMTKVNVRLHAYAVIEWAKLCIK